VIAINRPVHLESETNAMQKSLLLAALVPFSLGLTGCLAVGAVGGVLVAQEVLDNNVYVARLDRDAGEVWASAKIALNRASLTPIDAQDDVRHAIADVDDAKVTVDVETYDLNRSTLRVSAKKYGVNNGEIAKMVYDKIIHELDQ
jgi:hypothetical protein